MADQVETAFGRLLTLDEAWGQNLGHRQMTPNLALHCPVCGFDYNHPGDPEGLWGWEAVKHDGRVEVVMGRQWAGRGNGVAVPFACENGHRWVLCVGFHKGQCFVFATRDTDAELAAAEAINDDDPLPPF